MHVGHGYRIVRRRLGWGRQGLFLVAHPVLLWEALRMSFALRPQGSLMPSSEYLGWRFHTAYGNEASPTLSEDLAQFLRWRRTMRRTA